MPSPQAATLEFRNVSKRYASELSDKASSMTLAGPPECRQREDYLKESGYIE